MARRVVGEILRSWQPANVTTGNLPFDRSKRMVLHLPHQRFDPQIRKGDGKWWCDYWGQWGDLEDFATSSNLCCQKMLWMCPDKSGLNQTYTENGQFWRSKNMSNWWSLSSCLNFLLVLDLRSNLALPSSHPWHLKVIAMSQALRWNLVKRCRLSQLCAGRLAMDATTTNVAELGVRV